jgi:hypothetical protein
MTGYVFPLLMTENSGDIGWDYMKDHRDRFVPFSFEESSIDLALVTPARIVVDDVVYNVEKQYFNRASESETERILLIKPYATVTENGKDYIAKLKKRPYYYNGTSSYQSRKEDGETMGPTAKSYTATSEETTDETSTED